MTGQTIATRQPGVADTVRHYQAEFAQVLPSHFPPETFTRLAVGALKRNPELANRAAQNPASLLHALLEAASMGLRPGTPEYHLTPRGGKDPGVLGITGWQGEIELIYRAGAVSSVKAEVVYSGDVFEFEPGWDKPIHRVDWFAEDRGAVVGAYAYAVMSDGHTTSKVVVIGPREIKRAKQASATASSSHSPWTTDYPAMVRKTAIHQLANWVPTSAEYRREQLRAAVEVAAEQRTAPFHFTPVNAEAPTTVDPDGVIHEAEIIDPEGA